MYGAQPRWGVPTLHFDIGLNSTCGPARAAVLCAARVRDCVGTGWSRAVRLASRKPCAWGAPYLCAPKQAHVWYACEWLVRGPLSAPFALPHSISQPPSTADRDTPFQPEPPARFFMQLQKLTEPGCSLKACAHRLRPTPLRAYETRGRVRARSIMGLSTTKVAVPQSFQPAVSNLHWPPGSQTGIMYITLLNLGNITVRSPYCALHVLHGRLGAVSRPSQHLGSLHADLQGAAHVQAHAHTYTQTLLQQQTDPARLVRARGSVPASACHTPGLRAPAPATPASALGSCFACRLPSRARRRLPARRQSTQVAVAPTIPYSTACCVWTSSSVCDSTLVSITGDDAVNSAGYITVPAYGNGTIGFYLKLTGPSSGQVGVCNFVRPCAARSAACRCSRVKFSVVDAHSH
jgi:hypothetical protein